MEGNVIPFVSCTNRKWKVHITFSFPVLDWLQIIRKPGNFDQEIQFMEYYIKGSSVQHHIYRISLVMSIYLIRMEMNSRRFQGVKLDVLSIFRKIQFLVYSRCFCMESCNATFEIFISLFRGLY